MQGTETMDELKKAFSATSFRSGFLKLAILKMISERPMHGYALMKEIERLTGKDWRPSPGSIYPALSELQRQGLISLSVQGRKRIYEITPQGQAILGIAVEHVKEGMTALQRLLDYRAE